MVEEQKVTKRNLLLGLSLMLIWTSLLGIAFFTGRLTAPEPVSAPSKLDAEFVEKLVFMLEDMQAQDLVRLDYVQKYSKNIKSDGYKWDPRDIAKLAPYFMNHDIPVKAGIGVLKAENSGHGSKMGITLFGRGIRATTRRSEWDYKGSAMTLDRGTYRFLLSRPDIYLVMSERYLKNWQQNQEDLIFDFRTAWTEYIAHKIYKPKNLEMWKSVMLRELSKSKPGGKK